MNKRQDNTYTTSDLNIAAYLRAKFRLDIKDYTRDKNNRVFFMFDTSKIDIDDVITDYINGKDQCSIHLFTRELAGLRVIIRNLQNNR
jgi:hypothetical protein